MAHKKRRISEEDCEYLCFYGGDHVLQHFFAEIIRDENILTPAIVHTRMQSRVLHDSYILAARMV